MGLVCISSPHWTIVCIFEISVHTYYVDTSLARKEEARRTFSYPDIIIIMIVQYLDE
jgi:hypothetical protein